MNEQQALLEFLLRANRPLRTRLAGVVRRGIVRNVDDSAMVQLLQVETLKGHLTPVDVERFGLYGFNSVPRVDTEAVVLQVGGAPDHVLVIGHEDRGGARPTGRQAGEVHLYHHEGALVELLNGGDVRVSTGTTVLTLHDDGTATLDADLTVNGDVQLNGDLDMTGDATLSAGDLVATAGDITATAGTVSGASVVDTTVATSIQAIRTAYNVHNHTVTTAPGTSGGTSAPLP